MSQPAAPSHSLFEGTIPSLSLIMFQHWSYNLCYRGTDTFLARSGRKQARKHVRDARDFNNIETRAVIKFFSLQGKAPKEINAILTETLVCFLPGLAKDLSATLYCNIQIGSDHSKCWNSKQCSLYRNMLLGAPFRFRFFPSNTKPLRPLFVGCLMKFFSHASNERLSAILLKALSS